MNRAKNTVSKKGTVALLGLTSDNNLVVNPGVATKDMINILLNAVMSLTAGNSDDDVVRLFNAALASRNPELVFGTKEELQAELEAQNEAMEVCENADIDREIAELKEKVAKDIESEE